MPLDACGPQTALPLSQPRTAGRRCTYWLVNAKINSGRTIAFRLTASLTSPESTVRHEASNEIWNAGRMKIAPLAKTLQTVLIGVAMLLACASAFAENQIHKCVIDGAVTYQNVPCFSGSPQQPPTVEQLNIERKKRAAQAAASRSVPTTATAGSLSASSPNSALTTPAVRTQARPTLPPKPLPTPSTPAARSGCDGRRHCSQMTSCAEAKYFLANCPGVQMDGNRDGIPCEQQWCNR